MPTPLTDADKVLRNDTGIDIATNIASIASALTPSNITDLGDVNLTNPITDGQVIKYDTATQKWVNGLGNITMECTQAQYDAWKQSGQLKTSTLYVISDAPNLNATSQDLSYDGGATSTHDVIEGLKVSTSSVTAGTNITINRQRLWKMGKSCFLNLNCATSASLNGSSKICDLPAGFEAISGATFDLFTHDATNNVFYRGAVVGNKVQFNTTATIPSGAGLCINVFWYTA